MQRNKYEIGVLKQYLRLHEQGVGSLRFLRNTLPISLFAISCIAAGMFLLGGAKPDVGSALVGVAIGVIYMLTVKMLALRKLWPILNEIIDWPKLRGKLDEDPVDSRGGSYNVLR